MTGNTPSCLTLLYLLILFLFFLLHFCTLLALNTDHLWVTVMHKEAETYLNLQKISAVGISTCAGFQGTQRLLHQCINEPQCHLFVMYLYVAESSLFQSNRNSLATLDYAALSPKINVPYIIYIYICIY